MTVRRSIYRLTTEDHNKTLVGIHLALGTFFAAGLVASPWIIAQNFRNKEKLLLAVFVFGLVSLLALLMFSTAIAMLKRKPIGRN